MMEPHEIDSEQHERVWAGSIADMVDTFLTTHEAVDHAGQPCLANRAGTIAFLAHKSGVRTTDLHLVAEALAEYEARHATGNGDGLH